MPLFFNIPLNGVFQDRCHFGLLSYVEIAVLFALPIPLMRRLRDSSFFRLVGIVYFAFLIILLTGATTLLQPGHRSIDFFSYLHTCAGTGVHVRGNAFESTVINLSIWSVRYELLMYVIAAFFTFLPRSYWEYLWGLAFVLSISILFFAHERTLLDNLDWITPFPRFLACFAVGVMLHVFSDYIRTGFFLPLFFLFCFSISWYFGFPTIGFIYFGTAGILLLFSFRSWFPRWKDLDISYGIFVYGYAVQKVFVTLFPNVRDLHLFFLFTSAATASIALMSWHWCEQPCLRLKDRFYGKACKSRS